MAYSIAKKRLCTRSTTTIEELNDDVLRETFQYLDNKTLEALIDVCSTFRRNAQEEYKMRFKHKHIAFRIERRIKSIDLQRMLTAIRKFGPAMRFLKISLYDCRQLSPTVLQRFTQHINDNLNGLILENIDFNNAIMQILRPTLSRLRELTLTECSWEFDTNLWGMIRSCPKLRSLSLHGVANLSGAELVFPEHGNLPELVSFSVISCQQIQQESFRKFLKLNPQLREIEIDACPRISIPSIVQCCPQIVKLKFLSFELFNFVENAKQLARLTALKSLYLYCGGYPIAPVIRELAVARIPLECLQLHAFKSDQQFVNETLRLNKLKEFEIAAGENVEVNDVVQIVSHLNELTTLKLWSKSIVPTHFMQIVRVAPKLQLLEYEFFRPYEDVRSRNHLETNLKFNGFMFQEVLNLVRGREPQCRLVLKMPAQNVSVPMSVQWANENFLKLVYSEMH